MAAATELFNPRMEAVDVRPDEHAVRVLLVEDCHDYAQLVRVALDHSSRGQFEVVHADRLEVAVQCLELESYDAMLVDLGLSESDDAATIDSASDIAHRLPVIVLTGTQDDVLATRASEAGVRDREVRACFDRARLPEVILRAIKRCRRFGCAGLEPVICRIPQP